MDAYVLIHPERYPSNDWDAALDEDAADVAQARELDVDELYGAQVLAQVRAAGRAVCVLDPSDLESMVLDDPLGQLEYDAGLDAIVAVASADGGDALQVTEGAPAREFDLAVGDAGQVVRVAVKTVQSLGLPEEAVINVGGFARQDCVKRSIAAMRRAGYDARECPLTTMPLTADAALALGTLSS